MRKTILRRFINLECLLAGALLAPSFLSYAAEPPDAKASRPIEGILLNAHSQWDTCAFAGFPPGTRLEVLTWERAYTLALIRYRTPQMPAKSSALKALVGQVDSPEIADFEFFCKNFVAEQREAQNRNPEFVDSSGSIFDLFCRMQTVENARKMVDGLEKLKGVYEEETAGLPKARPVRLENWLLKAGRSFQDELHAYRAQLDKVKVELGLPPHSPIVPDRASLARFRVVFEGIDTWSIKPDRNVSDLTNIIAGLPALEADPFVLKVSGQVNLKKDLGQRARRANHLLELRTEYLREAQHLSLAIRTKDQILNLILAPPPVKPGFVLKVPDLIGLQAKLLESENRLVALWASFHAERFALARDSREPPGQDWKSFIDQIQGDPTATIGPVGILPLAPAPQPQKTAQ